ncbi:MAG: hypothetical protein PHP63_08440 [Candidatus Marinimicrobia bacterium]|jgi:hypothetical protein|nr:hypothetical protein [Candidatus Neomarinimicrobiota bacterium]
MDPEISINHARANHLKEESFVGVNLQYTGDPYAFWQILLKLKKYCEENNVKFDCGNVTTVTHEGA